ncbi:MAG: hypothetical protein AVDCRST_MAG02-691 [uncultured Rubrobacteraceae bacterium]|uniref:Uncharacterized protein n=1 Tax=uncultured Rubrobacteraceae bacterium TaxID=349277 RepID=A0A6J4QYF4_9ACTN|nr:MAG: hypothetical protein AVDCRST_MAG02-691 [uncultured Rubrobacteraceae bacterium]
MVGESVALGPLRKDLLPLDGRWINALSSARSRDRREGAGLLRAAVEKRTRADVHLLRTGDPAICR